MCLTTEEAKAVYECLNQDQVVSPIHFDKDLPKLHSIREAAYAKLEHILEEKGPLNPYEHALLHPNHELPTKTPEIEDFYDMYGQGPKTPNIQNMEDWSILSTEIHYAHQKSAGTNNLLVLGGQEKLLQEWASSSNAPKLQATNLPDTPLMKDYLDQYDSISNKLHDTKSFHDNRDVSTTYLGPGQHNRTDEFQPELSIPMNVNSHTQGRVLGGNRIDMLLDTGASKSYMSKAYYMKNTNLHSLPKYDTHIKCLQVGNGNKVATLFVIPITVSIRNHRFEIFTLVSEIQDDIDLVFGMKNMHEVEGEHSARHSEFRFLNRAIPIFPEESFTLKPGCKRYVKIAAPFPEQLSGVAIVKIVQGAKTITLQLTLQNNLGILDMVNTTNKPMVFCRNNSIGIVDIRSLGFYNIRHSTLQYNLSIQLPQFNKMIHKHVEQHRPKQTCKAGKQHAKHAESADPYPWLDSKDPRRNMTDEEILWKYIDLTGSTLDEEGKAELMEIIMKYKKAFSLRDEIGECPNIKVDIDVIDDTPFFVRPFPISEEDKPIMDWQMQRLVSLGILSRNTTSHTSPVMLITRKITKDKRPVVDFRLLNTRIRRHNTATPLMRDICQMLGKAQSKILSCVDLKDAFHSLKLTERAKDFCGILPYFGSHHYRYEVMPMGLSISPCKWIQYIGFVMEKLPYPQNYIAIMDDLLVHSKEEDHMDRILDMLRALVEHGLKLSPKKCQFFRDELVYMGNIFKTSKDGITITPIKTRQEAILNTPTPTTPKECKSFCGVVNYVSLFCPHLQSLLAPIYDLTRKGRPFVWTKLHQKNFEEIKEQMVSPPVLTLPTSTGRYILYSDTSKSHAGSALWQIQNGKPRLIGYGSKSLPKACANYGITELEMTGLMYNMLTWKFWLGKKDFDAAVDHAAIPHIMKAKHAPPTGRIGRLLFGLSQFTFHLYYVKGKDMILCDFLSRVAADGGDPMDLVPVAFNTFTILEERYSHMAEFRSMMAELKVMTRIQRAAAGIAAPPPVHGANKGVDPNLKPEKQAAGSTSRSQAPIQTTTRQADDATNSSSTPMLTSPRPDPAGNPRNKSQKDISSAPLINQNLVQGTRISDPHNVPALTSRSDMPIAQLGPMPLMNDPSQQIVRSEKDLEPTPEIDPNLETPLLEAQIEAMFRAPEPEDFILPPALSEHAKGKTMVAQNLPKQSDIDRLMKQLNRKILTQTRFPSSLKDLEAAYCNSAAFKDIYQFLRYNKLPTNRRLAKRIEANALDYYVLGTLLFKYVHQKSGDVEAVLCIPPSKIDFILDMYHGTLIGGHQGMNKTLRTLSSRYYCPRLADYIRAYIVGCHTCQLFKNSKRFHRPLQKRTYDISQPALANVSMDIKYMPKSNRGYKYMIVILCEITNFLVTQPLKEVTASEVCRVLVEEFIAYFSTPVRIVCDQDPAFMSSLCRYCFQQYRIQILTVGVTNHKSLQAEHGIKSLSNLILTHLTGLGRDWHIYAKPCMLTYNSFSTPNLDGFCPFELVFGRKPRIVPILEVTPPVPVTGTFKDAYDLLNKRLKYFREMLIKFRDKRFEVMNRDREFQGYTSGQLVYLFCPSNSTLTTNRRKFTCQFVGPLAIWKCFSPTQFVLMSLDGVVYPYLVEETRLKPGVIRTTKGNVFTLPALRQMVKSGYMLKDTSSF